jgi:hypothetical protein
MLWCIQDPDLARLLARNEKALPDPRVSLLICGFLLVEILGLLTAGAILW